MDKTSLETVIQRKAEQRFKNEWQSLLDFIYKHPIGSRLKITVGDNELKLSMNYLGGTPTRALLDPYPSESVTENTNYSEIKEKLLKEYQDEELKNILDKLDGIKYLFEQV